jgi:5S rRNA maturation endonuclease (ribonuclease M5)
MPALADSVPSYIEHVLIIADADPAGQRGAHGLAERLSERRIDVAVKTLRRANEAA